MSDQLAKFPEWLAPHKNEWRSASLLHAVMRLEGRPFRPWFMEVSARIRSVRVPATNGKTATKYLVKQVWAAARAHGIQVVPGITSIPPAQVIDALRQRLSESRLRVMALELELANRPMPQPAVLRSYSETDLLHLVASMTEARPLPGVYLLVSADAITYVGQSGNVLARMSGHRSKDFASVRMLHVPDQSKRLVLERWLIQILRPRDNIAGVPAEDEAA